MWKRGFFANSFAGCDVSAYNSCYYVMLITFPNHAHLLQLAGVMVVMSVHIYDLRAARLDARSGCSIRGFQTRLNALARSRHAIAKLSSASRRVASAIAAVRIYSSA